VLRGGGPMSEGLRERKKRRTQAHIRDNAMALFRERGFESVTVGEIAAAAEVSRKTVFNYFPTKEDLVYSDLEAYEEALLAAIRARRPGESALKAFGRFVLAPTGLLAKESADQELKETSSMIASSPALLAREHQVFARYTAALGQLLAEETDAPGDDARPWVAATSMIGLQRTLIAYVRGHLDAPTLAADVRKQGRQGLRLLERGLGSYAER
jgi:AcrR family transcriptional regulator